MAETECRPCRGDAVEMFLKVSRDRYLQRSPIWVVLNDLLDDYRQHADTGTPLGLYVSDLEDPES